MDESFEDLETELKGLSPRRPSSQLVDRIEHDLSAAAVPASSGGTRFSWALFPWRLAGLAAVFAMVTAFAVVGFRRSALAVPARASGLVAAVPSQAQKNPETPIVNDRYQPVAAANVLYDLKDEGPATIDGDTSARRVRYRYLDTYTWKNSRGNASLKLSVPRDEIRVIPASFN